MFKAREYHQKHCTECALDKPPCYQLVETREWIDLKKESFFFLPIIIGQFCKMLPNYYYY